MCVVDDGEIWLIVQYYLQMNQVRTHVFDFHEVFRFIPVLFWELVVASAGFVILEYAMHLVRILVVHCILAVNRKDHFQLGQYGLPNLRWAF